ncbi:uncharacterized protein LAESUDRAFT_131817 [Laetiporus sulphureus 93-53]|uniref:F-box domain-containing protein n=1 Tax=Laetiporus sulphureus 93-53 TaxID=1314785 RepID=A0A165EHT2_9APHY|nr:uncharacterized protein LAESUDRAFT_131817 [Laetiporus sulphureus 93-53]KZT07076.1 hypothetical protein LAESUDRAFT_131817 [Laetiporus sulphureus 93-53]
MTLALKAAKSYITTVLRSMCSHSDADPTSHRRPRELPLDVWRHVIADYLQDDTAALQACSLTCRAWLPIARRQLFRTVTIRQHAGRTCLTGLLDAQPRLARYIRELKLKSGHHGGDWLAEELGALLPRLPDLVMLAVEGHHELGASAIQAISSRVAAHGLRGIHLSQLRISCDHLVQLLTLFRDLAAIGLHHLHITAETCSKLVHDQRNILRIREVAIESIDDATDGLWLCRAPFRLQLRVFKWVGRRCRRHLHILASLLRHVDAAATLEHLVVGLEDVDHEAPSESFPYLRIHLRCLRTIWLHIPPPLVPWDRIFRQNTDRASDLIVGVLSQIESCHMENITIGSVLYLDHDFEPIKWRFVDRQLTRLGQANPGLIVSFLVEVHFAVPDMAADEAVLLQQS